MRYVLLMTLLATAACDAAFTDLRPEALVADSTPDMSESDAGLPTTGDAGDLADASEPDMAQPDVAVRTEQVISEGMFTPRANYGGEGTATLVELPDGTFEVRLGDDFQVGSVPGPTVILAREDSLGPTLDPARGDLELGVLESNSGASTYAVPGDPGDRRIVWIYCKPFGLQMASATMEDL